MGVKVVSTGLQPGVFENWLAAAPVVALGAPLGAFVVAYVGRKPTLLFVAVLCVGQFVWTCHSEWTALGWTGVATALGAVGLCLLGFERLRVWGAILVGERRARHAERLHAPTPAAPPAS